MSENTTSNIVVGPGVMLYDQATQTFKMYAEPGQKAKTLADRDWAQDEINVAVTTAVSEISIPESTPELPTQTGNGGKFLTTNGTVVSWADVEATNVGVITSSEIEWEHYATEANLPPAGDKHGMFAHVHATGHGYVAHAGQWVKLANYSDLTPVTLSGDYADLINKPVLFSGSYTDLTNKPTIPTNTNQLSNGAGFLTSASLASYATQTYVNTSIMAITPPGGFAGQNQLNSAISNIVNSAPEALNTLNELALALGSDANYATTTATALGNRLRVDVNTQNLTTQQKTNARTNLGLATVASSGSYTDLSNPPTIPTNTSDLTNGAGFITTSQARAALSFTAGSGAYDSSTGVITIPTNTSHLTNGAGYITSMPNAIDSIRTTATSNVDFGTSWNTVNSTYYRWNLPAAGTYMVWCTLRARVWGVNAFGKIRLFNVTAGAAVADSDTMLIESQVGSQSLNMMCSALWKFVATGATTLYLQGISTSASACGIQADSNGWNELGYIRIL